MAIKAQIDPEYNHVAIRAKDLDALVAFYEGVVGLERQRIMGDPERPRAVFLPALQLLRTDDSDPSVKGVFDHVGISVTNIEDVCANLAAAGIELETPLTERLVPEVGRTQKLAFFRDIEGNRVELVSWQ